MFFVQIATPTPNTHQKLTQREKCCMPKQPTPGQMSLLNQRITLSSQVFGTYDRNRQLVTEEPAEFEIQPVEEDSRKSTDHFRGILEYTPI